MRHPRTRGLGALLALLLVVPTAGASHLQNYANNPVEHDDQGRSAEPDFARTSVLGAWVENRVYDPTPADPWGVLADSQLPPKPPGQADTAAPGCTDDAGRKPSGLCGLWTLHRHTACLWFALCALLEPGVQGMSGPSAPGRFTPLKASMVRLLDAQQVVHLTPPTGGVQYIEVNRKADDARASLPVPAPSELAAPRLLGPTGLWAWYGLWQDRNGNGVIDELWPGGAEPTSFGDEWTWVGNCLRFPSGGGMTGPGICQPEPTTMLAWVWPGNHHAGSATVPVPVGGLGWHLPADLPGRQVLCLADIAAEALEGTGRTRPSLPAGPCPTSVYDLDETAAAARGDPLLDDPDWPGADVLMIDRSGDPSLTTRQWLADPGFSMMFYDEGVLSRAVVVTAVFPQGCDLGCGPAAWSDASSVDVDLQEAVHPALDALVRGTVKPSARSAWVVGRDAVAPYAGVPLAGPANDRQADRFVGPLHGAGSGAPHEPNHALDAFPVASGQGPDPRARHHGWYTDYSAYAAGPRAWLDAQAHKVPLATVILRITNNGDGLLLSCYVCVAGVGVTPPAGDPLPRAQEDAYVRSLGPGGHVFSVIAGRWHDRPQVVQETALDTGCLVRDDCEHVLVHGSRTLLPPDRWVGNVVNTTGYFHYRGFTSDQCPIQGPPQEHPYAWCHPYRDGALEDPNAYSAASAGEFVAACPGPTPGEPRHPREALIEIVPLTADGAPGTWQVPVFVKRWWHHQWIDLANPNLYVMTWEDWTGKGKISMVENCSAAPLGAPLPFRDLLLLPVGNLGQDVRTVVRTTIALPDGTRETITDVDEYAGWGG